MTTPMTPNALSNQLVRCDEEPWRPLAEPGAKGVYVKVLRVDENSARPSTVLVRFEPGAGVPARNHFRGEVK